MTNSTVSDVLCIGPADYQDKKLNDVTSFDYECTTTGIQNVYILSTLHMIKDYNFRLTPYYCASMIWGREEMVIYKAL